MGVWEILSTKQIKGLEPLARWQMTGDLESSCVDRCERQLCCYRVLEERKGPYIP